MFLLVAFHPFYGPDQADGEGEDEDFVQRFQENLEEHEAGDFLPADEASEGDGEKDEGIRRLAHYGGDIGAQGEVASPGGQLHTTHYVSVQDGTHQKGGQAGGHNARCHTEDEVEVRPARPVGRSRKLHGQKAETDDEKVHQEARPDNESGFLVSPHLGDAVV